MEAMGVQRLRGSRAPLTVRQAKESDCAVLAPSLRPADRLEVRYALGCSTRIGLLTPFRLPGQKRIFTVAQDRRILGMFGVNHAGNRGAVAVEKPLASRHG
jgi:hypothetical protein